MITLMSDLHMEFWTGPTPSCYNETGDILVLAGDIAVGPNKLEKALIHFASNFNHVIYVFGNHEYYGYNLNSYNDLQVPDNVHVLNPGTVTIDPTDPRQSHKESVTFVGVTLWTNFHNDPLAMHAAAVGITDFKRIKYKDRKFSPLDCVKRYEAELLFIKQQLEKPGKKVIVTHFLPSQDFISPYWQQHGGLLNKYFASNALTLGCSNSNQLDTNKLNVSHWHTHDRIDIQAGPVSYQSNPMGYESCANNYQALKLAI